MYLESKQAVTALVHASNQHVDVPACPGWRVRDVLAHLVGQLEDVANGNTEGGGTDAWTAAQVERYRPVELDDIFTAWDAAIRDAGAESDDILRMIVPDLVVHEFDIRGALGNTGNRDNPALLETSLNFIEFQQDEFNKDDLPAVRFVIDGTEAIMGEGEPELELRTDAFEFTRLIFGRRSKSQILAQKWSIDPTSWLDHILLMPPRETGLVE